MNMHENRLRSIVSICEEQFGFVKGKSTTGVIFALRQLKERYREGQHDLHCVFIDLGKKLRQNSCGRTVFGACETRGIRAVYQTGEEHVGPTINVKVY